VPSDINAAVFVAAEPAVVFEYFTRPELLETWMGQDATLDATPGGAFAICVNGTDIRGRYVEVDPPNRLVISWGFAGSADLPPGASMLEVRLVRDGDGTMVSVNHCLLPGLHRDNHRAGWRRYLDRLTQVVGADASS
jgi:uncharacterized protein YndB with AHSA1/START domain